MADTTNNQMSGDIVSNRLNKMSVDTKTAAGPALAAGRDLRDTAANMVGASADAIKAKGADLVDAAKDAAKTAASQAGDRIKQTVEDQKGAGADYVGNLAQTMRRAAQQFDADIPIAGVYMRKAASQVENISDQIKSGNVEDLYNQATTFARRQPTAFLGLAVLAGFGAVRFLKSSAGVSSQPSSRSNVNQQGGRDEYDH